MKRLVLLCMVVVLLLTAGMVPRAIHADLTDDYGELLDNELTFVTTLRSLAAEVRSDMAKIRGLKAVVIDEKWRLNIAVYADLPCIITGPEPPSFLAVVQLWNEMVCSPLGMLRVMALNPPDLDDPPVEWSVWADQMNDLVETIETGTYTVELAIDKQIAEIAKARREEKEAAREAAKEAGNPCFIATAAYGTPEAAEIDVLRQFRDEFLLHNPSGRAFVSIYYELSPPVADFISEHEVLRTVVREDFIDPVVKVVEMTHGWWGE